MKVLISGKNSYIGDKIGTWLLASKDIPFEVDFLDVRLDSWKKFNFWGYDAVIHVAGIVHRKNITDTAIYHKVNTVLPVEVAKMAKSQGVKQFVFLSTMAVYGMGKTMKGAIITKETLANPRGPYGDSKYKAELLLKALENDHFTITIIRLPNVYGKKCKGGYITGYASIVRKLPAIPDAFNDVKQSVIYIDNLTEFCKLVIINRDGGVFLPQDDKAVSAVELMSTIAKAVGTKRCTSRLLGLGISLLSFTSVVNKGYGGIAYTMEASKYEGGNYVVKPFNEAIKETLV
ncbi:NAD-dependent epimerase/dehydratase family protein [Parabacteroides faecis]|uniref:NAD-dependent epimerase/dehydratase family protein n=1 Tax=Parabacteroides faecis TaxID=1217282 RepID=UPI00216414D5|nr:NAD-dependent epimerase/dehydratase family protein [Parabacteroides faecis]MCS2893456.1 NAD-dependent epimerase/dehydratase family protein [Parabacteroides faecis]UVQ47939.1 NAD-dependent epimerase/dehydratase family protein [Parabacteroides faecis]